MEFSNKVWGQPVVLSDLDAVFGSKDISEVLPTWEEIPEDFKNGWGEASKWIKKVEDWFYSGITALKMTMKEDVDPDKAMRHLKCILSSWEPKHEHKTAGVAYLMSLWFDRFDYMKGKN